jgi:hypothetical protein
LTPIKILDMEIKDLKQAWKIYVALTL